MDWEHEKFEDGSEFWTTEFRGFPVSISKSSLGIKVQWTVRGSAMINTSNSFAEAQSAAIQWVKNKWEEFERLVA